MSEKRELPRFNFDEKKQQYSCEGEWTILNTNHLFRQFLNLPKPTQKNVIFNGQSLTQFDSAAALILYKCIQRLKKNNHTIQLDSFKKEYLDLLDLVSNKTEDLIFKPPVRPKEGILYQLGKESVHKVHQVDGLVSLIGDLTSKLMIAFRDWKRFQAPSIISNIYSTGITALPILGLLSFLVGVVLAYQMGVQLQSYGATMFVASLTGMAIFREFGPLIAAIIVAGRTSSAFTAQIGSMKLHEEIDALHTMGLSPTELLVVPKVLALLFVFPLLIFWSDVFGVLGAMIMSKYMIHVSYSDYIHRLQDAVGFKQLKLGLYKAPAFSILIALVGCFQGFRVGMSAESVGHQTTKSVVQALFLIIVTDATYSLIYSWLDL